MREFETDSSDSCSSMAPSDCSRGPSKGGDQDEEQTAVGWESGELGLSPGSAIVGATLLLRWASVFSLFDGDHIDPITSP